MKLDCVRCNKCGKVHSVEKGCDLPEAEASAKCISSVVRSNATTGWISVNDRLPEGIKTEDAWTNGISSDVLIFLEKMYCIGKYFPFIDKWIIPGFTGDWRPSHWMPLPDKPEV